MVASPPMSDRPRVGVAVLNYRGAADTIACLASLRAVPEPIDVIVVDNGSDDGSIDEIQAAAPDVGLVGVPREPRVRPRQQPRHRAVPRAGLRVRVGAQQRRDRRGQVARGAARRRRRRRTARRGRIGHLSRRSSVRGPDVGRRIGEPAQRPHSRCHHAGRPGRLHHGRVRALSIGSPPRRRRLRSRLLLPLRGRRPRTAVPRARMGHRRRPGVTRVAPRWRHRAGAVAESSRAPRGELGAPDAQACVGAAPALVDLPRVLRLARAAPSPPRHHHRQRGVDGARGGRNDRNAVHRTAHRLGRGDRAELERGRPAAGVHPFARRPGLRRHSRSSSSRTARRTARGMSSTSSSPRSNR